MGVLAVPRPSFGLWGRLVFWFGRFFCLCLDGRGWFFRLRVCWVGWDEDGENVVLKENILDLFRGVLQLAV
jgi:hypothetical protein